MDDSLFSWIMLFIGTAAGVLNFVKAGMKERAERQNEYL